MGWDVSDSAQVGGWSPGWLLSGVLEVVVGSDPRSVPS